MRATGVKFTCYLGHAPESLTTACLAPILEERGLGEAAAEDLVEVSINVVKPDDPRYARKLRAHLKFLESRRKG